MAREKLTPITANQSLKNQNSSTNGNKQQQIPTIIIEKMSEGLEPNRVMKFAAKRDTKAIGKSLKASKKPKLL